MNAEGWVTYTTIAKNIAQAFGDWPRSGARHVYSIFTPSYDERRGDSCLHEGISTNSSPSSCRVGDRHFYLVDIETGRGIRRLKSCNVIAGRWTAPAL